MDIQATEAAQALGYADMTDDFDARAAVAAALFSYGFPEEGDRVLDGLVQVCVRRPWMEAALLPLLVSAGRNAKATALARRLGKAAGGDWECWSSVARTLADAGLREAAVQAAIRALETFALGQSPDAQHGLPSWVALRDLTVRLRGLLAEAAGLPGLRALVGQAEMIENDDERCLALSRLAGELADLRERQLAGDVSSTALALVAESGALFWVTEGTLAAAAEPLVKLGDRERLLLLVDIVRAIDRQGLRGICAVECVEALLKAGLVEAGVALLRDGAADMRASATRPARRCAERW